MTTHISVPIATEEFVNLVDFLREQGSDRDPVQVISMAIEYWIQNATDKPEDLLPETFSTESRGYMWTYDEWHLFLPHGTEIRMRYKARYYYAKVEGDEIMYEGQAVSPGTLANTITKNSEGRLGSRNAWRDLWIKRPGEREWTLADQGRREERRDLDKMLQVIEQLPDAL